MGSTKISQPSTPAAPTTAQNMQDYVANLPAMYAAQLEWSPKFNQQDFEQAAIYAPLMKQLQDTLYPNVSAVPEQIAKVAMDNVGAGMPQYMKDTYADQFRAEVGNQAGSGIGADYVSRNMLNQNEQYKQYYNNLALSVAGMQPLSQSSQYQQAYNPSAGYSYGQVANNNAQNYGSYIGGYSSMYNANANRASARDAMYGQMVGGAFQGAGAAMASSEKLKHDISKIENALETLKSVDGVTYKWNKDDSVDGGVIAERLEESMPDSTVDINEVKHVKPMMIIGYLIEAVKELSNKVDSLQSAKAA